MPDPRPIDPPDWPEPDPDLVPPNLTITEPGERTQVALGNSVTVKFRASDPGSGVKSVEWSLNGAPYVMATPVAGSPGTWSASFTVHARIDHTVRVRAIDKSWDTPGGNVAEATRTVVGFDPSPPELDVEQPKAEPGQVEAKVIDAVVTLRARARDLDPTSGVSRVWWSLDGMNREGYAARFGDAGDGWSIWTANIALPSREVPKNGTQYTLTVRAYNPDEKYSERKVSIRAIDGTDPRLEVTWPPPDIREIPGTASGATVSLKGRVSDTQDVNKLYSGVNRVELILDGQTLAPAPTLQPTGDGWLTWSADVKIPAHDEHTIAVRCYDKEGKLAPFQRTFVAALPFEVKDLGPRSYLKDLVDFATRRLKQADGTTDVNPGLLANTFHQPFAGLISATGDAPSRQVQQVRVCIEVLRDYLRDYFAPRPTAHWSFDEVSGTVAPDASGNGNAGTLQGPTRVAGRVGGALSFDGIDDYVATNLDVQPSVMPSTTWAAWVYPTRINHGSRQVILSDDDGDYDRSVIIEAGTGDFGVFTGRGVWRPVAVTPNEWQHIAVVYTPTEILFYKNGVRYREGNAPMGQGSRNLLQVGRNPGFGEYFQGRVDEVRIYDRALSSTAVQNLFSPVPTSELAKAEAEYRQAAYQTLLRELGTSYEEIRLARVAEKPAREALAGRLGIELGPTRPDRLDRLFLRLDQVTEADLERLFGLAVTTRGPLDLITVADPELLSWRLERLRALWKQQDRPTGVGVEAPLPIIDPDLVRRDDLMNPTQGSAFELWDARRKDVDSWVKTFRTQRESKAAPLEGFDHVVDGVLAPLNLPALAKERSEGKDIEPRLKAKQLSLAAFDYLVRVRNLASAGSVLTSEWEDVYSILAQVRKLRSYEGWRDQERLKDLTLGPDHFRVAEETAPPAELPVWRATERARRAWQNTLRARIDQQQTVAQALQTSVDVAEEATLPLLRDALVRAIGSGRTDVDVAEALTRRLLIDVKSSGQPKTTRIDQAVETLQSILFSARAGHFKERAGELDTNPAAGWKLEQRAQYKEEHFDQELKWMGSQETWRAAMFAFLYPENLLLPSLRENSTEAFKTLVTNLRKTQGLTPQRARDEAKAYLTKLDGDSSVPAELKAELKNPQTPPPNLKKPFEITDQLDEAQLLAHRSWVAGLSGRLQSAQAQTFLKEIFYFVPVQLALQLQQSGEYLTALDWFQTVYAYNLPPGQRKIYDPLKLEDPANSKPVNRTIEWLLNSLNPHNVAFTRANAYTRFTLMSLARCFLEYADAEFARDTDESLPRARALYLNTLDLLESPEIRQASGDATPASANFPPNPVPQSLRRRAELNLFKLRTGRNFAGMQRQLEPVAGGVEATNGLPNVSRDGQLVVPGRSTLRPTPYYYSVLIERAKQLVAISQQVEAAYLSALERTDAENFGLLEAGHAIDLARGNVKLQGLREKEARGGEELANRQRSRAQVEASTYDGWIKAGPNRHEQALVRDYNDMRKWRNTIAGIDAALTFAQSLTVASSGGFLGTGLGAGLGGSVLVGALAVSKAGFTAALNNAETHAQINSLRASQELRKQEWELRRSIAEKDMLVSDQQIRLAKDHLEVAKQEHSIAQTQSDQARAIADFLTNKFTNAELYEFISGVLGQVYGYFLRQSAAVAQLAQNQLAFERQETPPSFIQADYWQSPSQVSANGAVSTNGSTDEQPDRRGLTGSARLLQDIYQLDQHAFDTNERKLQLTQTFSLAQSAPFEFQRFRETGKLPFATPMELFDRVFPGHYLRLIHRVRTSVVALVPPTQGIKATLSSSGVSRVVTGGDVFQTVVVRRDPETVALSSPMNATGLFELDPQSEMRRPFEMHGVDASWEFQMPKAANPFDYRTIADVLVTIEYTALNSHDYRRQVIQGLDRAVGAERPFSLREQFPDQWYDLHNPGGTATPMTIRFTTTRDDFPPNVEGLNIQHLALYFVRADGATPEVRVNHLYLKQGNSRIEAGVATSIDRIISTRSSGGVNWTNMEGAVPVGEWELVLDEQTKMLFEEEKIEDILFVVTYSGETPEWPA